MCLCTQLTNRINLVCTSCKYSRKGFRDDLQLEKCPTCQKSLSDIGSKIKVPKKSDIKGWKDLKILIEKCETFSVCQC